MKPAPLNLLLEAASKDNILVLTTNCSTACVFCSHLQNPADINAYYVDKLNREQIDLLIEFLDGTRKIVIGESATRICEGEPFLREDILDILHYIRLKYESAPIQITTSGIHLSEAVLYELKRIGNIELNVSLNSSSIQGREKLYRGKTHPEAVEAVAHLKQYGIGFSGSVVAMPHLIGWEDIRNTILFLNCHGASTIRIFMPGYTRFTKGLLPLEDIGSSLRKLVTELGSQLDVPIILEPSGVSDLEAVVEGILRYSPALSSGILKGDRIINVNGEEAVSRVHAYYKILKAPSPKVEVLRAGECRNIIINKQANMPSGLVFNYDIHPDTIDGIERALLRNRKHSCLILTSELAFGILKGFVNIEDRIKLEIVKNAFFGGNIMCAGLLTLKDVEEHLGKKEQLPEVLLLPGIMFDSSGKDLIGRHYKEIEEGLGIKVEVI